ncbi:unnamed protein product [Closterium sp. NIES-64]|nr:unnamed protein product [Closterium sp. NIES-64]
MTGVDCGRIVPLHIPAALSLHLLPFCTYPHLRSTHPSFPLSPSSPLPFSDSTLISSPHTYLIFPLLTPPLPPHPPLISLPSPTTGPPSPLISLTPFPPPSPPHNLSTFHPPWPSPQLSPARPSSVPIHSLLISLPMCDWSCGDWEAMW